MTLPMPTRGPISKTRLYYALRHNSKNNVCDDDDYFDDKNDPERGYGDPYYNNQADIDLIAAAFNAAEAARQMGYDPIAAIQAVPKMLDFIIGLEDAAADQDLWADSLRREWKMIGLGSSDTLSAARTRQATP